jgi:3-deoxy-7-phosphoheptulonate synthase
MFIAMKKSAHLDNIDSVISFIKKQGVEPHLIKAKGRTVIDISREEHNIDKEQVLTFRDVEKVFQIDEPYRLVSREFIEEDSVISIGDTEIGGEEPLIIAGPCSVENEEQIFETARMVKEQGVKILRGGAFKPRTSPYSFQGLRETGLELLAKVREETGLYIITEVVNTKDISIMFNYELLKTVGRMNKPVLLKRSMSAKLEEYLLSAEYIMSEGNSQIILCERGIRTFDEFSRNTLDLAIVPAIKKITHLPIIVDPSHGTGRSDLVEPMSMAALAAGADGLIIEVHPQPEKALSDAHQTLNPQQFSNLMNQIRHFTDWQKAYADASHSY